MRTGYLFSRNVIFAITYHVLKRFIHILYLEFWCKSCGSRARRSQHVSNVNIRPVFECIHGADIVYASADKKIDSKSKAKVCKFEFRERTRTICR